VLFRSANTMAFIDHPHTVVKAVPFLLPNTWGWDPKYYASLYVPYNYTDKSKWVETHMMDFTDPDTLPLVRIGAFDEMCRPSLRKWLDNTSYQYEQYVQPLVHGKEVDDDGDVVDEEDGYFVPPTPKGR
jgi:hypothetical protein